MLLVALVVASNPPRAPRVEPEAPRLVLQSNFWSDQHQFLYLLGWEERGMVPDRPSRPYGETRNPSIFHRSAGRGPVALAFYGEQPQTGNRGADGRLLRTHWQPAAEHALKADPVRVGPLFREGAARYTDFRILGSAPEWVFPTDGTVSFVSLTVEGDPLLRRLHWDERGRLRRIGGAAYEAPAFAFVLPQGGDSVALYNVELGRRIELNRSMLAAASREGGGCRRVLQPYIDAYNAHDPNAVAAAVTPDFTWYTVTNGEAVVEVEGAESLRRWLHGHFRDKPTTRSSIVSCAAAADRVTAVEEATWTANGVHRSATAVSIYQIEEGRVRRVWYVE